MHQHAGLASHLPSAALDGGEHAVSTTSSHSSLRSSGVVI